MSALRDLLAGVGEPGDPIVHVGTGATVTRAEVEATAAALSADLRAAGVAPGEAVAVSLPNGSDLVAALFAVWGIDAVYVPLNPRLTEVERAHIVDAVRPAAIVTDGPTVEVRADAARYDDDIALVSMTSGTTGRPKPVLLRHEGVLATIDGVIGTLRGARGTAAAHRPMPNLVPVSLSLWAGIYQVLFAFRVGAPIVILPSFETQAFAELVARHGIRSTVLPPAAMVMLCDDESLTSLAPLKYARSISAPLSPMQARRFHDRFAVAVLNCWGQTETGGEIVGWSAADWREFGDTKLGAVGRPHDGVAVRAVGADGDVPAGEAGELWVATAALTAGYADGADLDDRLTPDGWFRTGDIGRVDAEGFVWIDGRVSDMINRGGLKVFPAEVAEVLRLSPSIADAHLAGVPDDRLGEVPWAFLVLADGASAPPDDELQALCRAHLAPYKVPVRFEIVDALPRNEIGKVIADALVTAVRR